MDEFKRNLEQLKQLVDSGDYSRIAVYARPGEGKTRLLEALEDYLGKDTEWTVFTYEECTIDTIEPPYVLSMVDAFTPTFDENPEKEPEVYFLLKYSDGYKKKVSGVKKDLGPNATLRDYIKYAKLQADEKVFDGETILVGPNSLRDAYKKAGHAPT